MPKNELPNVRQSIRRRQLLKIITTGDLEAIMEAETELQQMDEAERQHAQADGERIEASRRALKRSSDTLQGTSPDES